MTTQATTMGMIGIGVRPSLEELVERVFDALFPEERETVTRSVAGTVHDARRLRKAGNLDGALETFACANAPTANEARWAYAEWRAIARRRFADRGAMLYSPGAGRAAALAPREDGALEVLAALGMRWKPGKVVSRRSLRGIKPLEKACPRPRIECGAGSGSSAGASWA